LLAHKPLLKDLVLVGGGHAHALVLKMLAMAPIEGLRITLISPASHTPYSGMLPGLVAGHYSFEQTHIDLARLCQWAGVRFIAGHVTAINRAQKTLSIAGRPAIGYDVLSLDVGCEPELDSVPGARQFATPVKPVSGLWQRWQALLQRAGGEAPVRIAVVGGGAGSIELALAIAHRLADRPVSVQLYCGAQDILQGYNRSARKRARLALAAAGVELLLNHRVTGVQQRQLVFTSGASNTFDELFWCTGASAAPWLAGSGLATDEAGFLAIADTLQSVDDDNIFAAGDCATQVAHPRPKAGVYAVRQGPVLAHNLQALLLSQPLHQHHPQQRFLSLVSLGSRHAVADRGPFAASGGWVWRWKDRIDKEFMGRFEQLQPRVDMTPRQLPQAAAASQQAHCGGCGAKVGAEGLGAVLQRLSMQWPQHCRAEDLGDDAAVISTPQQGALLQSVDVLREIVSDPWLMGRIAVNHALSDLYACGATPTTAMATITLPFADEPLLQRELEQILSGALHEMSQVDCRLVGGHSLQGAELNIGFVVNGEAAAPLAKQGIGAGHALILTKPLGTGTLFAAHMALAADGRHIQQAVAMMLRSNHAAGQLAAQYGASACTDVTGFGLAGHLLEMLQPGQCAQLQLATIPALEGALACLDAGLFSTMHQANSHVANRVTLKAAADTNRSNLLYDPQTSGGLLISVAPEQAQALCDALSAAGDLQAEIIGKVIASEAGASSCIELT
jgi:selenide, water dikinase